MIRTNKPIKIDLIGLKPILLLWILLSPVLAEAQKLLVRPYLQDAEPNSIKILWETDSGEESIVEWGTTPKLGKRTMGRAFSVNYGPSRIHEVRLTGLSRFTP
ncbi:MAG: fibronectin type III domain-containing protein [Bacteroidota bacterium]